MDSGPGARKGTQFLKGGSRKVTAIGQQGQGPSLLLSQKGMSVTETANYVGDSDRLPGNSPAAPRGGARARNFWVCTGAERQRGCSEPGSICHARVWAGESKNH